MAEEEILKAVRMFDVTTERDAFTVHKDLVQDVEFFFKMISLATSGKAFQQDCQ